MLNVCVGPEHVTPPKVYDGTTEISEFIGTIVLLTVVKIGTFPFPEADNPIDVVGLVH